jgi:hypothetical protein
VFAAAAGLVCAWWLIANQVRYGDPLASEQTRTYLRALAPHLFTTDPPLAQAFVTVPRSLWASWWYTSGWNQFRWDWGFYIPFWLGLLAGLAGLLVPRGRTLAVPRGGLPFLALALAGVLATLWIVGMDTTTMQGRLGFYGLGAIAILFALGLERARPDRRALRAPAARPGRHRHRGPRRRARRLQPATWRPRAGTSRAPGPAAAARRCRRAARPRRPRSRA